jgi:hypothetical protein
MNIHEYIIYFIPIEYNGVDVVEWSRALDVRLNEWCCSVSIVWVQILGYILYPNDHGDDMNLTSEMALAYHFG